MTSARPAMRAFWFQESKTPSVADYVERLHPDVELARLDFSAPDERNWAVMREAHAYFITSARDEVPDRYKCNGALLARCPSLLVVSTTGAGYDTVDVEACTAAGVLVVNQAGANAQAVAEHAVGMMLALGKNMLWTDRSLRRERGVDREAFKGWNAHRATVGVIGLGEVGRRVARICGAGLEMTVLACDPYVDEATCRARGAVKVGLDELLARSRYVTIHCPRTAESRGMIGGDALARMAPGSFLINTARGGIVDEQALVRALRSGHLGGAGVDVWDVEPPPLEHPLLALDNVIATYHTAGVTVDSRTAMAEWNARQVADTLRGARPPRLLNPSAWERYCVRYAQAFGHPPG